MFAFKLLKPEARLPAQSYNSAGFDLFTPEDFCIAPGGTIKVPLGIASAIPPGWYGSIRDRSGLAAKYGITILGGVIDADYRGEWVVILHRVLSKESYRFGGICIEAGKAIAQVIFQQYGTGIMEVEDLNATERGSNGFGSTG